MMIYDQVEVNKKNWRGGFADCQASTYISSISSNLTILQIFPFKQK